MTTAAVAHSEYLGEILVRRGVVPADRTAARQAMKDLQQISRSENLKPEDREKLAKSMRSKGRRAK